MQMAKILLGFLLLVLSGCAMFSAWKAIPPPGGCDQCHTLPISADWVVVYKEVSLMDETGKYPWQRPEAMLPPPDESPLEQQKVTEERCFRCHKGPNAAHIDRVGRYHH